MAGIEKPIGLQEALNTTLAHTPPLPAVQVPLWEGLERAMAAGVQARVDSPSVDASLMDGFAVWSSDLSEATKERPTPLTLSGSAAAGSRPGRVLERGHTLRVMTGAPIPSGADAVVAQEFTTPQAGLILFGRAEESGANILPRGSDVVVGQVVARAGQRVTPGLAGLLAAAGHSHIQVIRPPRVALLATGDEVVAPGNPLAEGKLYASNITTLDAWCRRHAFGTHACVVGDELGEICRTLEQAMAQVDVVITSGGAWTGDRDLMVEALQDLGWQAIYHGVRMIPGKGTGFGLLHEKPVFLLPGGPPANLMGFLQLALPGLQAMAGHGHSGLPQTDVRLASAWHGKHKDWTRCVFGTLERQKGMPVFHALLTRSRLLSMAQAEAIVSIPEGQTHLAAGTVVRAQVLNHER